jgi:hypothetical protein
VKRETAKVKREKFRSTLSLAHFWQSAGKRETANAQFRGSRFVGDQQ